MNFDITLYGMGVGLVMVGWVCGLVVSMVFSLIRRLGTIA